VAKTTVVHLDYHWLSVRRRSELVRIFTSSVN